MSPKDIVFKYRVCFPRTSCSSIVFVSPGYRVQVSCLSSQDIVFKLGYFERREHWSDWYGLVMSAVKHYSHQVRKGISFCAFIWLFLQCPVWCRTFHCEWLIKNKKTNGLRNTHFIYKIAVLFRKKCEPKKKVEKVVYYFFFFI